jgi:hypothetical protein
MLDFKKRRRKKKRGDHPKLSRISSREKEKRVSK